LNLLTALAPVPMPTSHPIVHSLRHGWAWFVSVGLLVTLLGVAALVLVISATIASVVVIGMLMIVAGVAEIVMGIKSHNLSRFFLWILGGIVYIAVGAFALAQPLVAAALFTLVLGLGMVVIGVIRVYIGSHLCNQTRRSVILAGLAAAVVGVIILIGWPTNSFVVLGVLLGLDLIFWGVSWVVLGLRLHAHHTHYIQTAAQ
jgi:uncharacterized membrane protein HdeD (DUF308 family)